MKTLLTIFAFALIFVSCSRKNSDKELLTSSGWALDPASADGGDSSQTNETLRFLKDGTYTLQAGDFKVNGKWSWKKDDEIYVAVEELKSNNGAAKFDKTSNYNIRILEINDKSLRILEKGEADSWDSGFAKEKKYVSQK